MMRKIFGFFLMGCVTDSVGNDRMDREIHMAEQAIFWGVVASQSGEARDLCAKSYLACSDDRMDLGLSLLARIGSDDSRAAMAGVLRFKIDGGISESYICLLLDESSFFASLISTIDAKSLRDECEGEFLRARNFNESLLHDVHVDDVCSTIDEIEVRNNFILSEIRLNHSCSESDY